MPSVSGALLEVAIILAGVAALLSHAGFRRTIAATPRALRMVMPVALGIWFVSQIAEIETATYPLMSWHMYGESLKDAPIVGYRLLGEDCAGMTRRVSWSGGSLGRRPNLASAIPRAHRAESESGGVRERAAAITDSLLRVVLDARNSAPGRSSLCALHLQRIEVPASAITQTPLPAYETVRTVSDR